MGRRNILRTTSKTILEITFKGIRSKIQCIKIRHEHDLSLDLIPEVDLDLIL